MVQDWPLAGTYCLGSLQMAHAAGGAGLAAYCVPQVGQMKQSMASSGPSIGSASIAELRPHPRPDARVESRNNVRGHPRTEYRVVYAPVPGSRDSRPAGWCQSEAKAWQAACVRLGLRVRRPV